MPQATNTLKILAVDDARSNLLLLEGLLGKSGHTVVTARDGLQAIEAYEHEMPDVILMDVVMPVMDGIEAARQIRERNAIVPIIFLSADTEAHSIERALQFGTDYITKPIQHQQLVDKLNAHFRSVLANREVLEQKKELQRLHNQLLDENQVAAHVLSRMLSRMKPPGDMVQYSVVPSGMFSGDIVLAGTTPSGRLHLILADAIGHGLPAAFTLLPLIPPFNAMTSKGFPLQDILAEINKTLRAMMPVGQFVAATAISLDHQSGLCEIWIGGNPGVLIRRGNQILNIPSTHLALGIADSSNKDDFAGARVQLQEDDSIVLFSDGLIESWTDGDLGDFILACPPVEIFERVQHAVYRNTQQDDSSLVVLRMDTQTGKRTVQLGAKRKPLPARISLELNCVQMTDPDILHTIIDMAQKLGLVNENDGLFGLILSELFSNALDHGVLGLSSELKYAGPAGFDAYMQLREQRLSTLHEGHISVQIEAAEFSDMPATLLRIVDSGPGFDQAILTADSDFLDHAPAGRGVKLVMNTCHKLSYAGNGNDVTAYIPRDGHPPAALPPSLTASNPYPVDGSTLPPAH